MTRDQTIAHLELHGYVPYANPFGWVLIWSEGLQQGRMAKFFEEGKDGPGWDVRDVRSNLALASYYEVPWHRLTAEDLEQLTAKELPPRYRHTLTPVEWDRVRRLAR